MAEVLTYKFEAKELVEDLVTTAIFDPMFWHARLSLLEMNQLTQTDWP